MTKAERLEKERAELERMLQYERDLWTAGNGRGPVKLIAGVDEVGRGPLSGPVVTAAVILPEDFDLPGVNDSKKLSEKRRESLFAEIAERALGIGIGIRDNDAIDRINILEATKEAMVDAVFGIRPAGAFGKTAEEYTDWFMPLADPEEESPEIVVAEDRILPDHILIDALTLDGVGIPQTGIVKGDANSVSIAAASIIAKVVRDHMMDRFEEKYPGYGFASNKGYGTKAHYQGLDSRGACRIHRRSFLVKYFARR
ncbi:MAG: ribonuclease HII [Clostridia bacterium]|nr:ribonuclease HII [Clostridia bacterium]